MLTVVPQGGSTRVTSGPIASPQIGQLASERVCSHHFCGVGEEWDLCGNGVDTRGDRRGL